MKTKKLNLGQLNVESFVTSIEENKSETLMGGVSVDWTISIIASAASVAILSFGYSVYILYTKYHTQEDECIKSQRTATCV